MTALLVAAAVAQMLDGLTYLLFVGPELEGGFLRFPVPTVLLIKAAAIAAILALAFIRRYRTVLWAVAGFGVVGAASNLLAVAR